MGTVFAICASPPLPNPGMASVDLALQAVFKRHHLPGRLHFVRLYSPSERNRQLSSRRSDLFDRRQALPIRYNLFRNCLCSLFESDCIIYWGDFFHSRDYLLQVAATLVESGLVRNEADALQTVFEHFYLAKAPADVLARCVAFGGTLIFNRDRDYRDPDYSKHLTRFVQNVSSIWMRDIYSSARVNALLNDPCRDTLGVDCSLLLTNADIQALPRSSQCAMRGGLGRAGIFFGRTRHDSRMHARFAREVCRHMRVTAEWLPWFDDTTLPSHLRRVRSGFREMVAPTASNPPLVGDLLERVAQYKFVITDTYHVALNAWRSGVAAVCIGDGLALGEHDMSTGWRFAWRDKRYVFYSMHEAMEFYVFAEELLYPAVRKARVGHVAELLKDATGISAITARITSQAQRVERRLALRLRCLLAKETRAERAT